MSRLKKTLLSSITGIVVLVVLPVAFASPLSKYLIEKYDEKFLGRKITIEKAYVNPFTGFVYFSDVKIYELNKDSLFISIGALSANFAMTKLLFATYEISELVLHQPKGLIIQNGNKHELNFNDIITKFTPKNLYITSLR